MIIVLVCVVIIVRDYSVGVYCDYSYNIVKKSIWLVIYTFYFSSALVHMQKSLHAIKLLFSIKFLHYLCIKIHFYVNVLFILNSSFLDIYMDLSLLLVRSGTCIAYLASVTKLVPRDSHVLIAGHTCHTRHFDACVNLLFMLKFLFRRCKIESMLLHFLCVCIYFRFCYISWNIPYILSIQLLNVCNCRFYILTIDQNVERSLIAAAALWYDYQISYQY